MLKQFKTRLELLRYVYENKLFEYSIYSLYGYSDVTLEWKDESIRKIVEADNVLSQTINDDCEYYIEHCEDYGGNRYVYPTIIDNQLGFFLGAYYDVSLLTDELYPEGELDANLLYTKEICDQLRTFNYFSEFNDEEFKDNIKFSVIGGGIEIEFYDASTDTWEDCPVGLMEDEKDKVLDLLGGKLKDIDYTVISEDVYVDSCIHYYSEDQLTIQDEFMPLEDYSAEQMTELEADFYIVVEKDN